jgi:HSP20 family protein
MHDLITRDGLSLTRPKGVDDWFNNMFRPLNYSWSNFIKDESGNYVGEFDIPGFGEGDIDIVVDDGIITLKGQKESRKVNYSMPVPKGVDCSRGEALIKNGVLKIILPIAESAKPKQIKVKGADE